MCSSLAKQVHHRTVQVSTHLIDKFAGDYAFLSNFFPTAVTYKGITYQSSEHAYQAQKATHRSDHDLIMEAYSPARAKRLGKTIKIRGDWLEVRVRIMEEIVRAKFDQHKDLADLLVATNPQKLAEGNNWGDQFWGTVNGLGLNRLGIILMKVRDELIRAREVYQ